MNEQQEKELSQPAAFISEQSSTKQLKAELAQISAQLNTYPFRQDNKRISALLKSPEGEQLSRETRQHLEDRQMENTMNAVRDERILELFLREHEIEIILRKRKDADLYAVEGTVEPDVNF